MRFTRDFPFVFAAFCRAHPSLSLYFARNFGMNRRQIPSVSRMPSLAKPTQSRPRSNSANTPRKAAQLRAFKRPFFIFFLSRVHSCTIRLISLFPMTKNARYGRINFRGRLAQRERRCLTSIGSGVQIPHRPPFERTMAAHLSSHFLFSIIYYAISIQIQRIRLHHRAPQIAAQFAPQTAPRVAPHRHTHAARARSRRAPTSVFSACIASLLICN